MNKVEAKIVEIEHYLKVFESHVHSHIESIENVSNGQLPPQLIKILTRLEEISSKQNITTILIHTQTLRAFYVSKNIQDNFGYNLDELLPWNISFILSLIAPEHLSFPLNALNWSITFKELIDGMQVCGLKIIHKNGHTQRVFIEQTAITFDEKGWVQYALIQLENISYLLKDDFYWVRYTSSATPGTTQCFWQNGKTMPDILTFREKEILRFIADGFSSREIGELLSISTNTVEKHRKNMIARCGARDTTALIQLCKMCKIL